MILAVGLVAKEASTFLVKQPHPGEARLRGTLLMFGCALLLCGLQMPAMIIYVCLFVCLHSGSNSPLPFFSVSPNAVSKAKLEQNLSNTVMKSALLPSGTL